MIKQQSSHDGLAGAAATGDLPPEDWGPSRALVWLERIASVSWWFGLVVVPAGLVLTPLLTSDINFETTLGPDYGIDIGPARASTYTEPTTSAIDGLSVLEQTVEGVIPDATAAQWLVWALEPIMFMLVLMTGLYFARRILRETVLTGRPFGPADSRALRFLGLTILVGSYAYKLVSGLVDYALLGWTDFSGNATVGFVLTGGPILWCVALFALASLFDYAIGLRRETELTI